MNRNYAQVIIASSDSRFEYLETFQFNAKNDLRMQWSDIQSSLPCCSLLLVLSHIGSSHLMMEIKLRGSNKLKWEYLLGSFNYYMLIFAVKQVEELWVRQLFVICTEFFLKSVLEWICLTPYFQGQYCYQGSFCWVCLILASFDGKQIILLYCLLLTAHVYFNGSRYSLLDPSLLSWKVHACWFLEFLENPVWD